MPRRDGHHSSVSIHVKSTFRETCSCPHSDGPPKLRGSTEATAHSDAGWSIS